MKGSVLRVKSLGTVSSLLLVTLIDSKAAFNCDSGVFVEGIKMGDQTVFLSVLKMLSHRYFGLTVSCLFSSTPSDNLDVHK